MTASDRSANRISAVILYAAVMLAPLPFGSVDTTAIAFWCIVLGCGVIALNLSTLLKQHLWMLAGICIIVLAYALVLHEQLARDPWFAAAHPIWAQASALLGTPLTPSVSIARNQPFYALGAPLVAMLTLICSIVICTDRTRCYKLLTVIAWSGAAYALYGIVSFVIEPGKLLWRDKEAYQTVLTATFVNRNTAAVYFGTCAVVWLLLLSRTIRQHLPNGPIEWKKATDRLLSKPPRDMTVGLLMLFVCLAAMFMTGSRAGAVFSLLAMITAFMLYFWRDLPRRGTFAVLFGALALGLVLLQVMGAGISSRISAEGVVDAGRFETYRSTLRMIADHAAWGLGLGTFAASYPAYRSANFSLWGTWDRAHNTLLEIGADMGAGIALLVVLAWLAVIAILIHGLRTRRRDLALLIAALSVTILVLLHSMIDFPLQIPGFAIVVFAIVGAGLAQCFVASRPEREPPPEEAGAESLPLNTGPDRAG